MRDIVVVLARCDGHLNLGAIARLCSNHRVSSLRMVGGDASPHHPDAVQMAMHGRSLLPTIARLPSMSAAVADVDASFAFSAKVHAAREQPFTSRFARDHLLGRVALVFGNEVNGLNIDERGACSHAVHLPLRGDTSLNVAHAVAAALALCQDEEPAALADHSLRLALLSSWNTILKDAGYYQRSSAEALAPRLRTIIDRMQLTPDDAALLQSMMAVVMRGRDGHNRS
jgi:tRNA C32,U32 (ribose-2'-O)-methylase TrmJ